MKTVSGLEKYGIGTLNIDSLFQDEEEKAEVEEKKEDTVKKPKEIDFIFYKSVRCPVCDRVFQTISMKTGKAKRLESDHDLRPRFEYIDSLKYDVTSCPYCGYSALNRFFSQISSAQSKLIREGVSANFKPVKGELAKDLQEYTLDEAIERLKLALFSTVVKKGKTSELAYVCLKLAWLYREKGVVFDTDEFKKEENVYYEKALEGFMKAASTETFPMCGMDWDTVNLLLAEMALSMKKYDIATRYVTNLLNSRVQNARIKERTLDIKDEILKWAKAQKK